MKQICNNRFFAIYGKRRKASNELIKHADAVKNFQNEIFKVLRIPQIVEWLNAKLTKKQLD